MRILFSRKTWPTEPVAHLFHNSAGEEPALRDMIAVGVVFEHHSESIFNRATLTRVDEITREIVGQRPRF